MEKATQRQTKAHNSRLILKTIYDGGRISRADIARATGLARTTVSDGVGELIADGLVAEVGTGPSAGGKPPILLSVVDDSRHLIGINLADRQFRGAVVDLRGQIEHCVSLPTHGRDGDAALALACELIDRLLDAGGGQVLGIGIGTPGLMDAQRGVVRDAVNLGWHDLHLARLLEERYRLPVHMANDCQAAALAECTFGESKQVSNLILIRLGLGVGAGIVLNRQPYYGDGFGAGEIGHVVAVEGGELCRCGHRGCLETLVSSGAIVRSARMVAQRDGGSVLNRYADTIAGIDVDVVFRAFEDGDQATWSIIEEAGGYVGRAVAHLVGAMNIQRIVIAGSLARFGKGLLGPIRRQVGQGALAALSGETRIQVTNLEPDIVILGAAALLLNYELGLV